jgi:3'-phosphoadenosine 5'-phosphosulfate sulfotransferase (PAPS reductase)/FAD synthetase
METNCHVLGISGGKDSAARAIYLHENFPELPIEYYFSDTGKELESTYEYISKLEAYLGKSVLKLRAAEGASASQLDSFDYFIAQNGGFLPSSSSRWCTIVSVKLTSFIRFAKPFFHV